MFERTCEVCGLVFEAARANARYCEPAHRTKAYRLRLRAAQSGGSPAGSGETPDQASAAGGSPTYRALADHLAQTKQAGTPMGRALLVVANRIDRGKDETGASLSSLVLRLGVELRHLEAREAPTRGATEDEVAKARDRRDRSRSGAR